MPDTPVAPHAPFPYDPGLDRRVSRVEDDMRDMQAGIARVETALVEIKAMLAASLPHLATRAELAQLRGDLRTDLGEKPGKLYMWGILAVLVAAYAAGLAGLAVLK
ncbi:MAG: hypothetical protein HIU82_04130 [Proteobacteria bacterium]|nr:hypothetical protein [Pseudomonadota bacterium]